MSDRSPNAHSAVHQRSTGWGKGADEDEELANPDFDGGDSEKGGKVGKKGGNVWDC